MSGHAKAPLTDWRICSVPPGSVEGPDKLERAGVKWTPVQRAQPVAAALRESGEWSLDGPPRRFDAEEWWYRASFLRGEGADEVALCFDGLATLADVWLNGAPLLSSDNMFVSHERSVGALLADHNDVLFRFRSVDAALGAKRPRPRWRTPMVEHQQLRWVRSTLLGRTPGWSPPAAVVGPWRDVRIERRAAVVVEDVRVNAGLVGRVGSAARLDVSCAIRGLRDGAPLRVEAALERAGVSHGVTLAATAGGRFSGFVDVPRVDLWWPHTHGEPALYRLHLLVHGHGTPISVDLGTIGFREIAKSGELALSVNDVPLFCRGACWTPIDPVTLVSPRAASEAALLQVRDGGMNMLRVGGTMAYESDDFYDLADELGLLVWQDFMFANMDYPGEDPAFVASVEVEARQLLERLGGALRSPWFAATAKGSSKLRCGGHRASYGPHDSFTKSCRGYAPSRSRASPIGPRARMAAPSPTTLRLAPRLTTGSGRTCAPRRTRAAPRCASPPSASLSRTSRRPLISPAARQRRSTTPDGRPERLATSAPGGTSTTSATTTFRRSSVSIRCD